MKNRNLLIAFAALSILVIATLIVYFSRNSYKDSFASDEFTQFAVENSKEVISKIFLADKDNNQALLVKDKDGIWNYTNKVSGEKFRANPNAINNLLETIEKVRVRNRVPNPSVKSVLRGIATIGIKVELYDFNNKKIRTYYIGGPADGGQGTFAVVEGSNAPYVLNIPNFVGTVDTRFNPKENALRDRAIVRHNSKDLQNIEVEYYSPEQRPYSFKLDLSKKTEVSPLFATQKTNKPLKKEYVDIYLDGFNVLASEMIIENPAVRDSIVKTAPFAKISYQYKSKPGIKSLTLYPLINPNSDRGDGEVGIRSKILRYYVNTDDNKFYLTQDIVMQKLLRPYEYFFDASDKPK
jgi:hypothetical protein